MEIVEHKMVSRIGKDGTPFSSFKYENWVKGGRSYMKFRKSTPKKKVPKWFCDKCFQGPFIGRAISQHRKGCK